MGGNLRWRGAAVSKNLLAKPPECMNHSSMHHPPPQTDPCLLHAHNQWAPPLHEAQQHIDAAKFAAALLPLAEAIRISASFHPLFHYLESGLNTELAMLYMHQGNWEQAEACFTRAVFLHHDNATAIQGKQLAQQRQMGNLPAYGTLQLSAPLTPRASDTGIHAVYQQARTATGDTAIARYHEAIALCEATHLNYHQWAALPWLARAECFAAQGEDLLARNDIRHGMDLDRKNAGLLALSVSLAA